MQLKRKLFIGFMACNVLMLVVGIVGIWSATRLKGALDEMSSKSLAGVKSLLTISDLENFSRAAFRSLLIPDLPKDRVANQVRYLRESHEKIDQMMRTYEGVRKTPEEDAAWKSLLVEYRNVTPKFEEFIKLSDEYRLSGDKEIYDRMLALHLGAHAKALNGMRITLDNLVGMNLTAADKLSEESKKHAATARLIMIAALAMGMIAGIVVSILLSAGIMRHLGGEPAEIQKAALAVSKGDLTVNVDTLHAHEGSVLSSTGRMLENLKNVISHIATTSCSVSTSAVQLHGNTTQIAIGIRDIEGQTVSIGVASEEMATTSADIAKNCLTAAEYSSRAGTAAQAGVAVVSESIDTMRRIAGRVRSSADTIEALGARSEQIGLIIATIEDIADQTNLLALNAAIEAARAGEQGRGFAVVADEVRALAERTSKATHEIGAMITAIQHETKSAVAAMAEGVAEVERGMNASRQSEETLGDILNRINVVSSQITQIAIAAEEQTATTSEISRNIHKVATAVSSAAHLSTDNSGAVSHLIGIAEELMIRVQEFKSSDGELRMLQVASNDHRMFVSKIRSAVTGHERIDPAGLPSHHTCRFGKWYDTEGKSLCGHLLSLKEIEGPHERIHSVAKEAVAAANGGNKSKAEELFNEVESISRVIVDKLSAIDHEFKSSGSAGNMAA